MLVPVVVSVQGIRPLGLCFVAICLSAVSVFVSVSVSASVSVVLSHLEQSTQHVPQNISTNTIAFNFNAQLYTESKGVLRLAVY